MKLFGDLRDGDINPEEVSKNQTRFKSDLSEMKIGRKISTGQKNTVKNITTFLIYKKKNIDFFRDYSFWLSEAKYKVKYGEGLKILTPISPGTSKSR